MLGIAAPRGRAARLEPQGARGRGRLRPTRARADGRASLNNNIGWTYFDARRRGDRARATGRRRSPQREAAGKTGGIRIAKWTVARGLRATGALDDARGDPARARRRDRARQRARRLRLRGTGRDRARARRRARRGAVGGEGARAARRTTGLAAERGAAPRAARAIVAARPPPREPERREAPRDLRALARGATRIRRPSSRYRDAVRAAGRRRAVRAGDRQGRQQGDRAALPGREHAAAIARLGVDGLIPYISSIGLFRNKAKNVVALSRDPRARARRRRAAPTRAALEALPGVGRKTANVVLNTAFGQPTIAVDTHIFRVANRTGLAPGKDVVEVERRLEKFVPEEFQQRRAPLADPARPLRLRRAHAEVRRVHHSRPVRVPAEDEAAAPSPKPPIDCCGECGPAATKRGRPAATSAKATATKHSPVAPARTRGTQPMAKTARAGARRGRAR